MRRLFVMVSLFVITAILTCIGVQSEAPWLAMLGAIASAVLGTGCFYNI